MNEIKVEKFVPSADERSEGKKGIKLIMKYIFPTNYNFKNKILGIIDYPTLIFNILYFFIIFLIFNTIFRNLSLKIMFIIIFYYCWI